MFTRKAYRNADNARLTQGTILAARWTVIAIRRIYKCVCMVGTLDFKLTLSYKRLEYA